MIISNNQIKSLINLYLKQDKNFVSAKNEEINQRLKPEEYKLAVSRDAHAITAAKEFIRELPEVREDRLAQIQKQVKSGTYEVTDEQVAEKMIGRSLVDKLV